MIVLALPNRPLVEDVAAVSGVVVVLVDELELEDEELEELLDEDDEEELDDEELEVPLELELAPEVVVPLLVVEVAWPR